jgi:hypothetical protein
VDSDPLVLVYRLEVGRYVFTHLLVIEVPQFLVLFDKVYAPPAEIDHVFLIVAMSKHLTIPSYA